MMALGAAISGLVQGIGQGIKLRSELDDAEQRRGLMDLRKKNEQLDYDTKVEIRSLQDQIGNEIKLFNEREDRETPDAIDGHYTTVGALMKRQAVLAGKDHFAVDKTINDMRKDKYQEKIFAASRLLANGDESGVEILKPVYNKMFKDGNTLVGGAYDKETDSFNLTYTNKNGEQLTRSVSRDKLANDLVPLALNVADASKLAMKAEEDKKEREFKAGENKKDRDFKGGENEKDRALKVEEGKQDRGLRRDLNRDDNATRVQVAGIGLEGTKYSADKGAESRINAKKEGREDKDYDDFEKSVNDALGWNKNNPLTTAKQLEKRNEDAARMMGLFTTTREQSNRKLSAYEAAQIVKGIDDKTARYAEKDGYKIVQVGDLRAVMPKTK
jgi:hypothetical protein